MTKTLANIKTNNINKKRFSKKQNGGAARDPSVRMTRSNNDRNNNANIQEYITNINTILGFLKLENIKQNLSVFIPNLLGNNDKQGKFDKKCFTFEYLVPDANLDDVILLDPYKWYLDTTEQTTSNNFVSIASKNILVPQYIAIVMGMVKDLLLVLCLNRMPGLNAKDIERLQDKQNNGTQSSNIHSSNNERSRELRTKKPKEIFSLTENASSLLKNIEILIGNNIPYLLFTEILFQYIIFFSTGNLKPTPAASCAYLMKQYQNIVNSPYILLPSFKQIDFYKTIDLCKAPIVNFRLINTRRLVHTKYAYPCIEFAHDIFHARNTHHNMVDTGDLIMLFETRNTTFNKIQSLYHYPKSLVRKSNEELIKYQNCCILFILIHEYGLGIPGVIEEQFYTEPYTVLNLIMNLVEFSNRLVRDNGNKLYEKYIVPHFESFRRPGAEEILANLSSKEGFIKSINDLIKMLTPYRDV